MSDVERVRQIVATVIAPVHQGLMEEFGVPNTQEAVALSVAAMWQESKFRTRDQGDDDVLGPATGWGQFEKMGGVAEILQARQTKDIAAELCRRAQVLPSPDPVWRLFASAAGDQLHVAFVRLLTWKDPQALPPTTAAGQEAAYQYYDRNWRPGKKRPQDWPAAWAMGLAMVGTSAATPMPTRPLPPASTSLEDRVAALEAWARGFR